ncbi:ATP-dependent DNA ligase [Streptomyces sp. NPDC102467]
MEPGLVVEVGVDVARDASGRWRHPARWHRARPDLSPADVDHLPSSPS